MTMNASKKEVFSKIPGEDGIHASYCRLCEAVCGITVEVRDGSVVKVMPDRDHPVSEGHICIKGARLHDITYDPDRVTKPLKRIGAAGEFEEVSWTQALDDIVTRLRKTITDHGADSVGLYIGNPASFGTMHIAYCMGFMKLLGSDRIFTPVQVDTAGKHFSCEMVFGHSFKFTFPDLEECDFLIILGGNPLVSHMSLTTEPRAHRKLDDIAARGGVVVVDPRRTQTAARFEHVPIMPNTDVWLLFGMLNCLFTENLADEDLLERRVNGWREFKQAVLRVSVEEASSRCNISPDTIRSLARRFAAARTAACYCRVGVNRGSFTALSNVLVEAMNLVTGRFGKAGGWVFGQGLFGDNLTRAMAQYGNRRSRIGNLPLMMGLEPSGTLADEIATPGRGQLKALFIDGGNPALSYPRGDRLSSSLELLDLFVSLDFYMTETNCNADYILPVATMLERADVNDVWGTTAPRPFVQYADAAIPPIGETRVEYHIYDEILKRLDLPGIFSAFGEGRPTHLEAADTLLRKGPFGDGFGERPEGLSLERLKTEYPSGFQHLKRVNAEKSWELITFEDKRPRLWGDAIAAEIDRLLSTPKRELNGQLLLFGRRHLKSLNCWMHNSKRLLQGQEPTLMMHPEDARERGIVDGQTVRVENKNNSLEMTVEVTDEVIRGGVSYPHGWGHSGGWKRANRAGGVNINLLASSDPADWEPVTGACLLDGIPVTVTAATAPRTRISTKVNG